MRWLLIAGAVILAVGLLATLVGYALPLAHSASRQATIPAPPEKVWQTITDAEAFPTWRTDVKKVERVPDREGRKTWVEEGRNGRITFEVERSEPPRLLVLRIADKTLPFGGTWTYEIAPASGGSSIQIREDGEIYNPLFRFMARFIFGYEGTMKDYLEALHKKLSAES
jgi:Polyketide cyclase / dehydrase and lipid transport